MESKTKNIKTRSQIEVMVAKAFGNTTLADGEEAIVELKDGWFNVAYSIGLADGREVILKIAPPQDAEVMQYEQNIMATEVAAMQLVQQNPAIPVPQIYFYDDSHTVCDSNYFFMEKISGESLEHIYADLVEDRKAALERHIGHIIREINGFTGSFFGYDGNPNLRASTWKEAFLAIVESVLEDGAQKQAVYGYEYDEIRAIIHNHANALEEITTPCLVHWDAWNPNFFVQGDRIIGIIDFERALWAEPLMEAQFRPLAWGAGITDAMRGYGKTSFSNTEELRCWLYTLHLGLVMNTECYYRNYDTDAIYRSSIDMIHSAMEWLKGK